MILPLFRKKPATEAVYAVYSAIVAQSRQPRFYAEWGIPDTVTGRFDMISLHMTLLFRRMRHGDDQVKSFGQAVFDLFFKDMDRSLREMGVGDLGVPKKIQKMSTVFYGLLTKLEGALDRKDLAEIEAVLARNLYDAGTAQPAAELARYLLAEAVGLDAQPLEAITAGRIQLGAAA